MTTKRSLSVPRWSEALLLGLFVGFCSVQILVPPYIGLADNGDFPKVSGRFSCAPPDEIARNFRYFVANYVFDPKYHWNGQVLSSEIAVAAVPILLVKATGARIFNIRWLGLVHLLIYAAAYYYLLVYLRRFGRFFQIAIGGLALWIFTDVAYVAYFNSFFTDTAALLGLVWMVAAGLHLVPREPSRRAIWLFTAAAMLFITAKTQHASWGLLPAGLLASRRAFRHAALLVAAEAFVIFTTSPLYSVEGLFNVIFSKLAPQSASPELAVREVGLGQAEFRYIGTNCYAPDSPFTSVQAKLDFNHRTSFGRVAVYWLRHPGEAYQAVRGDLVNKAHDIRPTNLSNFRERDGHPPYALTTRFSSWSSFRAALFRRAPVHIVVWYLFVITGAGVMAFRRQPRGPAVICLGICAMAVLEFLLATLFDAIETERHLLIFHALTEVTICFAAAWAVDAIVQLSKLLGMSRSRSISVQERKVGV